MHYCRIKGRNCRFPLALHKIYSSSFLILRDVVSTTKLGNVREKNYQKLIELHFWLHCSSLQDLVLFKGATSIVYIALRFPQNAFFRKNSPMPLGRFWKRPFQLIHDSNTSGIRGRGRILDTLKFIDVQCFGNAKVAFNYLQIRSNLWNSNRKSVQILSKTPRKTLKMAKI